LIANTIALLFINYFKNAYIVAMMI